MNFLWRSKGIQTLTAYILQSTEVNYGCIIHLIDSLFDYFILIESELDVSKIYKLAQYYRNKFHVII